MKEKTIERIVEFEGVGLHSAQVVKIKLLPAKSGGIVFKNINGDSIEALFSNVKETYLGTTIGNDKMKVCTIEHLMASIFASNLDHLIIQIDNIEVPIMDGSAKIFLEQLKNAGVKELESNRKFLKITNDLEFTEGEKFIKISPNKSLSIDLTVDFNYGKIGKQQYKWNENSNDFELFNCRTFCSQNEIDQMRSMGLARGGTLDNAMVFDDNGIVNKSGFRCQNEVVKHKTLDLIGDLLTSGYYVKGKITANKTGHDFNNKFLKYLFENKNSYIIEE